MPNPRQVRDFAKAMGQLARPTGWMRTSWRSLRSARHALLTRRRQLLNMLTDERNRLEHATALILQSLADHIRCLERRVAEVDRYLDQTIERCPVWRAKENLLRTLHGVGPVVSRTLLSDVPELGRLNGKQIARRSGWRRWLGTGARFEAAGGVG